MQSDTIHISEPLATKGSSSFFWPITACLVMVYLFIALNKISTMPLIDPDEPRYAAAGRTMSRGESLLIPQFNGKPRINKPPLFYWAVALSARICGGATEFSARLPSVAMGLFMLLSTVLIARRAFDERTGFIAGAVLLSMPLFIGLSKVCITDMTLSAFMSSALGFLMLAMLQRGPPRTLAWIACVLFGLAVLTKATPAFALVLAVVIERALSLPVAQRPKLAGWFPWILLVAMLASVVSWLYQDKAESHFLATTFNYLSLALAGVAVGIIIQTAWRAGKGWLKSIPWLTMLLISLSFGIWWYAALIYFKGGEEFRRLLSFEIGQRLAGAVHREPMFYYLVVLVVVAFPSSLGLLSAIWSAWPKSSESGDHTHEQNADRFLLAWFLGILFFFSIPGAKLATYILPAMPAAAMLIARFFLRLSGAGEQVPVRARSLAVTLSAGTAVLVVIGAFAFPLFPQNVQEFTQKLPVPFAVLALFLALGTCGPWLLASRGRSVLAGFSMAATIVLVLFITAPAAVSSFLENRSTRDLCELVKPKIADCERVASVGAEIESLSYYLDCTVYESRRRKVAQRRAGSTAPIDKPEPLSAGDEPFDAVINEELARPEKVALIIQDRYYARILNMRGPEFKALSDADIARTVPTGARFIARQRDMVVIRSDK